jgi:selenocysteine lyase/cysteine desulfurase
MDRRDLIKALSALPLATSGRAAYPTRSEGERSLLPAELASLPDRVGFHVNGTFLNAAYTHPLSNRTAEAGRRYLLERSHNSTRNWPIENDRDRAAALYARLINADPAEIAVVPSTLEGENLIGAALGLGPGAGVVTDLFHQSSMLALYGEKQRSGMPLVTLRPKDWKIDYDELDRSLTPDIKLIAVSWVSSATGYRHDLKRLCEIAHRKNVLVYADVIQGVGAIPLDVRESGVDFCCAGTYKWLMGDFGCAFLYVRADRLEKLRRVQLGWRGVESYRPLPGLTDPKPGTETWALGSTTASFFEVSTPNWGGLACAVSSLGYILKLGVKRIEEHRRSMFARLEGEMPRLGFELLTPRGFQGPFLTFYKRDIATQSREILASAKIDTTLSDRSIRISPSVYNTTDDIDRLLSHLRTALGHSSA